MLKFLDFNVGGSWEKTFVLKFIKQSHLLEGKNKKGELEKGVEESLWFVEKFGGKEKPEKFLFVAEEFRDEVRKLAIEAAKGKKQKNNWKLDSKRLKLKPNHKKFLAGLQKNSTTTLWPLQKRQQALLYFYPDLDKVAWETVRRFYKEELDLSYKRCKRPVPPVELNFSALAELVCFLKEKVEEGY